MKIKMFVFPFLIIIILSACSGEKEYPVKITNEGGVKTVINPEHPKEGEYDLIAEELFTLGKEEDNSKYMFAMPMYIDLDSKMNLYVLDWQANKFFVFDKIGKFIREFGKKGAGPGDFELPADFKITKMDNIVLNDGRNLRICSLDTKGKYINGFNVKTFHSIIELDSRGNYFSDEYTRDDAQLTDVLQPIVQTRIISKYNPADQTWKEVAKFPGEIIKRSRIGNSTMSVGPFNAFFWKLSPEDKIYTGFEDSYQFAIYDLNGKLLQNFSREFKPYRNPDHDSINTRPEFLPAFQRYNVFDINGNFWVNIYYRLEKGTYVYDIFSPDGIFLKKVYSKYRIAKIQNDIIYSIVRSETDPVYIKAMKYSFRKR